MLGTGSSNSNWLNRDNSTIWVSNKSSISKTMDSNRVNNSTTCSMGNLGSMNSKRISRDNSTVSMSNKTMRVTSSIMMSSIDYRRDMSQVSEVSSSGSSNSRSVSGDNGSVGESNQGSG